ncbi:MAG TPA: hypothetical protein VFS39_11070 [Nitrospira sp.]|nr:hypothetical protein [Nitrospira sp.]
MPIPFPRLLVVVAVQAILTLLPAVTSSADETVGRLYVQDALVSPNQTAEIEALLVRKGKEGEVPVPGASLELVLEGTVVAAAETGPTGIATFSFIPPRKQTLHLIARTKDDSPVSESAAATVAAWERRTPLLVVEMSALYDPRTREPLPDAAEELRKLTQFYYNLVYVSAEEPSAAPNAGFRAAAQTRQWLSAHEFPAGYILPAVVSVERLGSMLDALRAAGWTTIKVGIGRTKEFAETFLQRRMEVVIVPGPATEALPKKAILARDWKDIRRKL